MARSSSPEVRNEAESSLGRLQRFDVNQLPRESELGTELNFRTAVEPAERLVSLYKRLALTALDDLPVAALQQIRDRANSDYSYLKQVLDFKVATQSNPQQTRDSLVAQITQIYEQSFQVLHPYIAYSLHRSADFQRLDSDARATMQAIADRAKNLEAQLQQHESEAKRVLDEVRKVAAEEGVTQQSIHFKNEAERHEAEAAAWQAKTAKLGWGLGAYAAISILLHKIPFLAPVNSFETVQLAVSKVLVFSVLAYMLFLAARNFLGHKHNSIVNRHRQNALMTHKALIEGASDSGVRDAIMVQAAGCIFSPQGTGYTPDSSVDSPGARPVVELLSKSMPKD